ncbi:PAAR domain-containing protein [Paraburkholderia caballeronis]|uniref:Zn-binding Pro-Ala-Ala-Arg (PAAR) domain-containing protein, incolved in TypeVI secretion n=1 Tax=Paraburkholderia caballeronis TaxID=416943 RepID=A0A1H7FK90_9BURK|nr:PAAR domain-containing protein [Paraburkholderia caballeronis]PXW24943.1 putative Zn-binding protein involved in type VI secretion [Paraburkholderia caballeronis]PXX00673.1 putative Zn-binding protein involved in type VI secretion [Paraburkholderia caballeronis]RAJ98736.1 putative Zn-binding protein involved in type VI secretion [Paraburkholderia caballeronis]TDV16447.1 putative Zn-binding protein involved in type VI secretion [Paraburkholderia caballeronis]TDV18843.1 putative Zn-binding pr
MFPAARLGDPIGHGGVVVSGSCDVLINGIPAAMVGASVAVCALHPSAQAVVLGSGTVFINNLPATFLGGITSCGAPIACGSPDVFVGV